MITNDVRYINLLVRTAHIICNHPLYMDINFVTWCV